MLTLCLKPELCCFLTTGCGKQTNQTSQSHEHWQTSGVHIRRLLGLVQRELTLSCVRYVSPARNMLYQSAAGAAVGTRANRGRHDTDTASRYTHSSRSSIAASWPLRRQHPARRAERLGLRLCRPSGLPGVADAESGAVSFRLAVGGPLAEPQAVTSPQEGTPPCLIARRLCKLTCYQGCGASAHLTATVLLCFCNVCVALRNAR